MRVIRGVLNIVYMLKFVAKYAPLYCILKIADNILGGLVSTFSGVIFIKTLFDKLEKGNVFYETAILIGLMAVVSISYNLFHSWFVNCYEPVVKQILHERIQMGLFEKAKKIDLESYDDPQFYNDYIWATSEAEQRAIIVISDISSFLRAIIFSGAVIGILFTIDFYVILAVIFSIGVTVLLKFLGTSLIYKRDLDLKPRQRKCDYINRVFYLTDYAKEIRMSKVEKILLNSLDNTVDEIKNTYKKYAIKSFVVNILRKLFTSILFCAWITLLLAYKLVVLKTISLGDFAASSYAIWSLYWNLNGLLDFFTKFQEHMLYIERLRVFLKYEPKIVDGLNACNIASEPKLITLRNVSFTYNNADKPTLKNINLNIKPYEKIALVGYNGAGKTTLVKLIMRLYNLTEGDMLIDNINIKNYSLKSYRDSFGVVFQDYQIFNASIAENIVMDDMDDNSCEVERVIAALKQSGLYEKISSFEKNINTMLTREFDDCGVNLSVGEMQKIAISRAIYKSCPYIILDEPSSALDPISEYNLNKTLIEVAKNKTVILISHRLSSIHMVDRIYMLENGEIIEQGSHDELIALNGKYAEMFRMQAEKYRVNSSSK